MTRQLRIAIFHLGFFYSGGGERLVLEEARSLRARGHEVEVFAPIVDAERCYPDLMREVRPRALLPALPGALPLRDSFAILASCVLAGWWGRRFGRFDVFLGHNPPGHWLARVAARATGKRYVAYLAFPNRLLYPRAIDRETSATPVNPNYRFLHAVGAGARPLIERFERAAVLDADTLLVNGTYMADVLRRLYGREVVVCAGGAEPAPAGALARQERYAGTLRVNGFAIERPFILLTNRHYPQKRFEDAIEGFARWRRNSGNGARFVITGQETSYTEQLRALVRERGLDDDVRFLGFVHESDLKALYASAACYVYPSPEEDFGMGIVEAMAQGTPVIACANAGPTGILRDGETGLLVPPRDVDAFCRAMARVLGDRAFARALGQRAHRTAASTFSHESHVDRLEAALLRAAR